MLECAAQISPLGPRHSFFQLQGLLMLAADSSQLSPSPGMAPAQESCLTQGQSTVVSVEGSEASFLWLKEGCLKGYPTSRAPFGISWCLCYDYIAVQLLPWFNLTSLTLLQVLILRASPINFLHADLCPGVWSQESNLLYHVFASSAQAVPLYA